MASTTEILSRAVAGLNGLATVFLLVGIFRIKAGDREGHGKAMKWAVITSALFLAVYLASKVHSALNCISIPTFFIQREYTRYA